MMDTVLNLGLNDQTLQGLVQKTDNRRFAWDCYRRLIHMFGDVVLEIPKRKFEDILRNKKKEIGIVNDIELTEKSLMELVSEYKELVRKPPVKRSKRMQRNGQQCKQTAYGYYYASVGELANFTTTHFY